MPKSNPDQQNVARKLNFIGKPTFIRFMGKLMTPTIYKKIDAYALSKKDELTFPISKDVFKKSLLEFKMEE